MPVHQPEITPITPCVTTPLPASARRLLPGLLLSAALAGLAYGLGQIPWLQAQGISALTLAILLGIVVGNSFFAQLETRCAAGVQFSRQRLLRLGIVLYGLRLTLQDIAQIGLAGVAIDALVLCSTFALALLVGRKFLKMERNTVLLIGAGSSICGAAAVLASEPLVRGKSEQVSVAVASVVLFGTLAMLLYPLLYRLNLHWLLPVTPQAYGLYAGSTIHEVAQVMVAAKMVGEPALATAVIAKMLRVMMLAPFLLLLSAYCRRHGTTSCAAPTQPGRRLALPWFALAFVAVVGLNSALRLPPAWLQQALALDTLLLAMAMAALGLGTRWRAVVAAGARPLLLAGVLAVWLLLGGALINRALTVWLG